MRVRVLAALMSAPFVVVALGFPGSGSGDGGSDGDSAPAYFFDWNEVASADAAPVATLAAGPNGTCTGRVQTLISLAPDESGIKSLTLAPVPDEDCVFEVTATFRTDTDAAAYASDVDAAMNASGCCRHVAGVQSADNSSDPEPATDEEDISVNTYCRLADGWAHTGYPNPPTVVYTRVYHQMDFCYDDTDAWIDSFQGFCFANQGAGWYTDPDECYWEDIEVGPADPVFMTLHGFFQKSATDPLAPAHDLWNSVHGEADGGVYCTGDIEGDYDGYARTNNCGATSPEPR